MGVSSSQRTSILETNGIASVCPFLVSLSSSVLTLFLPSWFRTTFPRFASRRSHACRGLLIKTLCRAIFDVYRIGRSARFVARQHLEIKITKKKRRLYKNAVFQNVVLVYHTRMTQDRLCVERRLKPVEFFARTWRASRGEALFFYIKILSVHRTSFLENTYYIYIHTRQCKYFSLEILNDVEERSKRKSEKVRASEREREEH